MNMRRVIRAAAVLAMAVSMCAGSVSGAYAYEWDDEEYESATQLDTPEVWWDGTKAEWDEVEDAYQYEIRIYRDGYRVDTVRTRSTRFECRARMDRAGEYTFRVRARAKSGSSRYIHSDWSEESESYVVDESQAEQNKALSQEYDLYIPEGATGPGDAVGAERPTGEETVVKTGWFQDNLGWWWVDEDGTYPVNQWRYINDRWYFFNESGYMKTGWISWNGSWYYCDSSGAMLTAATTPDGYYVDENGICTNR
ncbi:MAG TPA: hypothetical protein IAA17_05790 [Candidatus Lachnoclostridium stercorigallinarum]|uniref:Cell wall binding repeat-containing protein n=1 Tax=Candidatus Lachnoclostridium stercorigallinarum TaxID=2838634 RepID=A0A9D2K5E9_9FIRM|nr:hypothetical protein [Candidatus Lachnoclostridium stercorigallinarum]